MTAQPFEDQDQDAEFEDVGPELQATDMGNLSQEELDNRARQDLIDSAPTQQRIILREGANAGDAILALSQAIPTNEFGLPAFFYRSDLLPYPLSTLTQESCDAAVVSLEYEEGYPTYNGKIWWYQLPHEPMDAYMTFQRYLDQAETVGLRQLQLLSMEEKISFQSIQSLYNEYYWSYRSRSYDLFNIAAERRRRIIQQRKVENRHFDMAEALMEPLRDKLRNPDFLKNIEPKEAVEILAKLVNIQRVSLGLAANGNAGKEVYNPDGAVTPANLMKQITEGTGIQDEGLGINSNLQLLLSDPKFAFEAQALVIRVRHSEAAQASLVSPLAEDDE